MTMTPGQDKEKQMTTLTINGHVFTGLPAAAMILGFLAAIFIAGILVTRL